MDSFDVGCFTRIGRYSYVYRRTIVTSSSRSVKSDADRLVARARACIFSLRVTVLKVFFLANSRLNRARDPDYVIFFRTAHRPLRLHLFPPTPNMEDENDHCVGFSPWQLSPETSSAFVFLILCNYYVGKTRAYFLSKRLCSVKIPVWEDSSSLTFYRPCLGDEILINTPFFHRAGKWKAL